MSDVVVDTQLERYWQPFNVVLVDLALCQEWAEVMDGADRAGTPVGAPMPGHCVDIGLPLGDAQPHGLPRSFRPDDYY
jgi:hypothetical protein